jgi:hypothetical protein
VCVDSIQDNGQMTSQPLPPGLHRVPQTLTHPRLASAAEPERGYGLNSLELAGARRGAPDRAYGETGFTGTTSVAPRSPRESAVTDLALALAMTLALALVALALIADAQAGTGGRHTHISATPKQINAQGSPFRESMGHLICHPT